MAENRSFWSLASPHCAARVISSGAMLQDVVFRLGTQDSFRPFAQASWATDSRTEPPKHLSHLGGEWPCVPFGTSDADPEHHGFSSNAPWRCVDLGEGHITLEIDYPVDHAVRRLRRTIRLSETSAMIDMTLSVEVRRPCHLPIGLHPIFRLPEEGDIVLSVSGVQNWAAIPDPFRPEGAQVVGQGGNLTLETGERFDFPTQFTDQKAELVQAFDLDGEILISYPSEQVRVGLSWDAQALPHCLFWLANPHAFHGLGPFHGLGVEPVASWFDRGCDPLGAAGADAKGSFGVGLEPDEPWTLNYQIRAEPLGQQE
jgi:galactose mutarotase-like enzyme